MRDDRLEMPAIDEAGRFTEAADDTRFGTAAAPRGSPDARRASPDLALDVPHLDRPAK